MLAAILFCLHSFQMTVEAAGSSMATSTMSVPSRSDGSNTRSMWVTRPCEIRKATSSLRPEAGQTTVTLASALRQFRIRPAATCRRVAVSQCRSRLRLCGGRRVTQMAHLAAAHDEHFFVLDLPCQNEAATGLDLWKVTGLGHVQGETCSVGDCGIGTERRGDRRSRSRCRGFRCKSYCRTM